MTFSLVTHIFFLFFIKLSISSKKSINKYPHAYMDKASGDNLVDAAENSRNE